MFGSWLEETVQTRRRKIPPPLTLLFWGWCAGLVTAAFLIGAFALAAALNF